MNTERKIFKKMQRMRRYCRALGSAFVLVGGFLTVMGIHLILNPDMTMVCNGVVTNSIECKRGAVIFALLFFFLGLFMLFAKKEWINRYIVWHQAMPSIFSVFKKRKNDV
jgi:glucose-6-phosphate-specific signal transduction histidine kinase